MILIDSANKNGIDILFYDGIDIKRIINHPKDGSSGLIVCYIDGYARHMTGIKRESKIDSILNDSKYEPFDIADIENDWIIMYETSGIGIEALHLLIKGKIVEDISPLYGKIKNSWGVGNFSHNHGFS